MALSTRAASGGQGGSTTLTSQAITFPTGTTTNDLVYIILSVNTAVSNPTAAGWNPTAITQSTTHSLIICYRTIQSGDTAPTVSWTGAGKTAWTAVTLQPAAGQAAAHSGFGTAVNTGTAATTHTPPAFAAGATSGASVLLNAFRTGANGATGVTCTAPTNWVEPTNGDQTTAVTTNQRQVAAEVSVRTGQTGTITPGSETITVSSSAILQHAFAVEVPPPALKQQVLNFSSASPNQVSFPATPTAGNLVVVGISRWSGTDPTIASNAVTDNQGNTYVPAVNITANGDRGIAIFYAENLAASGTFTVSVALTDANVGIMEFTSAATSGSLDQTNSGTGTSAAPSAGSVTTADASEIYVAVAWSLTDGDSWASGSGWTLVASDANNNTASRYAAEWQQSAAGAYTGDFATGASAGWGAVIASFRTTTPAATPSRPAVSVINQAALIRSSNW